MKRIAIVLFLVVAAVFFYSEKLKRDQQVALDVSIAREVELSRIQDSIANDPFSLSKMIARPPLPPVREIIIPPELNTPKQPLAVDARDVSERFERDEIRRDISSLKRQVELNELSHDFQRQEDEQKARRMELEHSLGLGHPK